VDVVELLQHLKSAGADTLEFVELAPFLLGTEYFDGDRLLSTYLKEQNIANDDVGVCHQTAHARNGEELTPEEKELEKEELRLAGENFEQHPPTSCLYLKLKCGCSVTLRKPAKKV